MSVSVRVCVSVQALQRKVDVLGHATQSLERRLALDTAELRAVIDSKDRELAARIADLKARHP